MRVFSTLIDRTAVPLTISLGDTVETMPVAPPPAAYDPAKTVRPPVGPVADPGAEAQEVDLIDLAWARSGDKGDAFNVGVVARRPEYMPYIRAALTADVVKAFFAHEFAGGKNPAVHVYELPGLVALNFHCLDSLGGGQFASLRLDPLAKGKAQQLLDFRVKVPRGLVH
jgi:hypothetical protein